MKTIEKYGRWTVTELPTLPAKRTRNAQKPMKGPSQRHWLCVGKWLAMEETARIHGFEFVHPEDKEGK